ncbi:LIM domain-binding protein 2 isoform X3 [Octopus bimaculoides]|uniref:LIM domain-binding protein 2 isoform X3 n=1 Tax=Octopus bimaculoides TaxID=37653 RepID=UPI00071CB422|nr:LIM domain-binding protein 2 isoform X3 [Octopus bimaculoides]|eukprot:XP_014780390.1 PREDICTED: LIM domain-binding protein 2-like isoform X3 [Octopus bimaculoides]
MQSSRSRHVEGCSISDVSNPYQHNSDKPCCFEKSVKLKLEGVNFAPNGMPVQPIPAPLDREHGIAFGSSNRKILPDRRHTPYNNMGQPEYRIYDLNKRLQQRTEESDNLWWDAFATEFFEDDATLTLTFCLEDGLKRYTIGRTLIPRYFRSIFEGGITDLYYLLKHPKESFHNTTISLDCDQAMMITHHGKPMFTKVVTEGRLILEFTFDDLMRIRSWHFATRQHRELIPRSVIAMQQDPAMVEQLSKNITRQGLTNYTLNFLRLCVILEPMQELMSRHKAYGLNPRDCLKTTLFQKWQRMVAPPGKGKIPTFVSFHHNHHRKYSRPTLLQLAVYRTANTNGNAHSLPGGGEQKKMSGGPQVIPDPAAPGDVMVVGEPTLMGGEFGDEDERLITRLENTQYEPNGTEEEQESKFQTSPAPLQQSPWAQDKKPPPNPANQTEEKTD